MHSESPGYYVETWDANKQRFTPQIGVERGPHTHMGLRKALRALRQLGYTARRGVDSFVLVWTENAPP